MVSFFLRFLSLRNKNLKNILPYLIIVSQKQSSLAPTHRYGLLAFITSYIKTSLTSSRHGPQRSMYRAFDGREGNPFTLTLPSHFGSHSLTSINDVRARREKSEGDVRENEYPSRGFSPLYIRVCEGWREEVRVVLKNSICNPHGPRSARSHNPKSLMLSCRESDACKLSVRRLRTVSP